MRSNIEKSCELIAKGRADFNRVTQHVLDIFKKKLGFFKLSVGTMERILMIMLNTASGDKDLHCLSNIIHVRGDSEAIAVNFCNKCFKGHYCIQYHPKKGWGLKCDQCNYAIRIAQGAVRVTRDNTSSAQSGKGDKPICRECGSHFINVLYKEAELCPFPSG